MIQDTVYVAVAILATYKLMQNFYIPEFPELRETSNKQRDELFNENTTKKLRKVFEIDKTII